MSFLSLSLSLSLSRRSSYWRWQRRFLLRTSARDRAKSRYIPIRPRGYSLHACERPVTMCEIFVFLNSPALFFLVLWASEPIFPEDSSALNACRYRSHAVSSARHLDAERNFAISSKGSQRKMPSAGNKILTTRKRDGRGSGYLWYSLISRRILHDY